MKYFFYLFMLPVVLIAAFLLYTTSFGGQKLQPSGGEQTEQKAGEMLQQWETKTNEEPPVTITATPVEFGQNSGVWKFTVVFDIHSGSLDDDILKVVSLVDDKGNIYRPTVWAGPGPGGHHREGELVFNSVKPAPSFVELKIKDVGGVPERSFRWNLK